MCQCFAVLLPLAISCSYRSRLCVRASVRCGDRITRNLPSRVLSQRVSAVETTFFWLSHPGVQRCLPQSSRGPKLDSSLNGAERPCCHMPSSIQVVFAFRTSASARCVAERLWCLCLQSVWTITRSSFFHS